VHQGFWQYRFDAILYRQEGTDFVLCRVGKNDEFTWSYYNGYESGSFRPASKSVS